MFFLRYLIRYDPNLKRLMTILNNVKNRFHQPPLGPFLNYIKIKPDYQQWSLAVESILRPLLSSFVVFNSEDIITFNQIRENNHLRSGSSCYCKSEQCIEYDVSGYRPDPQYLTIMDTLEIHHPAIQNILIDILNIDVIILCNTRQKRFWWVKQEPIQCQEMSVRLSWSMEIVCSVRMVVCYIHPSWRNSPPVSVCQ